MVEYSASQSIIPKSDLLHVTVLAAPTSSSSQLFVVALLAFCFVFYVVIELSLVSMLTFWSGHLCSAGVTNGQLSFSFLWTLAVMSLRVAFVYVPSLA